MHVTEIKDQQAIQANNIYITPPGKDVTISEGRLQLSKPTAEIGQKPSIDYFFTSLSKQKGDRAVGIILSGTGSDGTHGMRAIKAEGGITIVQDESTAKYNGMPHAAIETGLVNLILPPEKIGPELIDLIKFPHVVPAVTPDEGPPDSMQALFQMLLNQTGCDFSDYKPSTIRRRIERRMAVHKPTQLDEYVRYLEHSGTELHLLFKDIFISVTSFFFAIRKPLTPYVRSFRKS